MLLRSSSTPVLGSVISSSLSDHSTNSPLHESVIGNNPSTPIHHHSRSRLSFHHTGSGPLNLSSFSCNSSPAATDFSNSGNFQRAQSVGNLEGLISASCNSYDELPDSKLHPKPSRKSSCPMLQTIPSFSFYGSTIKSDDEEDSDEEAVQSEDMRGNEKFSATGLCEFSLVKQKLGLVEEMESMNGVGNLNVMGKGDEVTSQMYLAKGLGVNGGGFGDGNHGGGDFSKPHFVMSGGDGDGPEIEEYYRRLVEESPGNPLFLRNYAQFLYESKQDLQGAEEYYSRAILADPSDGEILSQYAKLTWELHRDDDRTTSYFERAVQAAPEDSHVHAAYASYLWDAEEDTDEGMTLEDKDADQPFYHREGTLASASG